MTVDAARAPPSANYRIRKFAQKNRTALTTVATIALLFVTGTAISVWQAVRATTASIAADKSAQEARANELKAIAERDLKDLALKAEKAAREQARDALNTMTDDVIEKVFSQQPNLDETQKAFLRKVMSFYESFATQSRTSEESRFLAADGKVRVAKILVVLGERPEALSLYRSVIPALRDLSQEFPKNPEYMALLAHCKLYYGYYLPVPDSGDRTAEATEVREALEIQERLCKNYPLNSNYQAALAEALRFQTMFLGHLKRLDESEQTARSSLKILERLTTKFPENIDYLVKLGDAHNLLYLALVKEGKTQEAYTVLLRGIELLENSPLDLQSSPKSLDRLSVLYVNKFLNLMDMGNLNEAETLLLKAIDMKQVLSDRFPSAPDYRRDLARSLCDLGELRLTQARNKESIESFSQAPRLLETNLKKDPSRSSGKRGHFKQSESKWNAEVSKC